MKLIEFLILFTFMLITAPAAYADMEMVSGMQQKITSPSPELQKLDLPEGELNSLYYTRNYNPVWGFTASDENGIAARFVSSIEELLAEHGLRADAYPLDQISKLKTSSEDSDHIQMDILVTASLLRLAHDLHGDSIDLGAAYTGWTLHRIPLDLSSLLNTALSNRTVNEFITSLAPKNPAYIALTATLHTYRSYEKNGGWPTIETGESLRPGDQGPRVEKLRARLEAEDYLPRAEARRDTLDEQLEKALITYQMRNGLNPDGHGGTQTLEALNVPIATRIEQIRANMERWRHMPDDFPPERYAAVNSADASIRIIEDGKDVYRGPVVVGKTSRKTPFIQSSIRSMIVNPSWHVPLKIARKDILPKLKKDPQYLEKLGFIIHGRDNDPYGETIDWTKIEPQKFHYNLRQEPGDQNSLGHLKFDFNNDFSVYMHGTPHQELFAKAQRNFSSGCIRLRDPEQVGEVLLKDTPGHWNADKIAEAVDQDKTQWVAIKNPMPLYVLYWSVFTDPDSGAINFRKDVYGYDGIMEGAERSVENSNQ